MPAALLAPSSIKAFTNQAKHKYDAFFLPKTAASMVPPSSAPRYAKNDDHDAFLCHRWNKANTNKKTNTISPSTTKPTPAVATPTYQKAYATSIKIPVKDDPSVTPTLETLCTVDTLSSYPTYNNNTDAILKITIWNQPIIQYRMPIWPFSSTRKQSKS